jgi:acyl dehydratase
MGTSFLEDFIPGATERFGSRTVTREEIIAFATQFDPQPFHLDDAAAQRSPFGGLIASGWHTVALCHRMMVDHALGEESGSIGSPGVEALRWLKPVRPGDTLSIEGTVLEVTPSRSKPDRGSVKLQHVVRNQHGEVVMTMVGLGMFLKRSP